MFFKVRSFSIFTSFFCTLCFFAYSFITGFYYSTTSTNIFFKTRSTSCFNNFIGFVLIFLRIPKLIYVIFFFSGFLEVILKLFVCTVYVCNSICILFSTVYNSFCFEAFSYAFVVCKSTYCICSRYLFVVIFLRKVRIFSTRIVFLHPIKYSQCFSSTLFHGLPSKLNISSSIFVIYFSIHYSASKNRRMYSILFICFCALYSCTH